MNGLLSDSTTCVCKHNPYKMEVLLGLLLAIERPFCLKRLILVEIISIKQIKINCRIFKFVPGLNSSEK
jgi:hypothetical protein